MTSLLEKFASRLAADQKRFISQQSARLKSIGILSSWTTSKTRATAKKAWNWEYRANHPQTVYAEWLAKEEGDRVIVTRTEYGYLLADGTDPDDLLKWRDDSDDIATTR